MEDLIKKCCGEFRNKFAPSKNTEELEARARHLLPLDANDYKLLETNGTVERLRLIFITNIRSEEEFIRSYNEKNNETLRIETINKKSRYYRCKHKTRVKNTMEIEAYIQEHPNSRLQNTNCPFSLSIKYQQNDDYNALIEIEWNHNHSTTSLHSLTFKDIADETKAKIETLFHAGLLPGAAHKDLIRQLRSECESDLLFEEKLADRSIVPRRPDMNRLYGLFTKEMFGNNNIETMFEKLETKIDQLGQESGDYTFKLQKFDEQTSQPFILVVITPLMKRVHQMVRNSKDLVFIDSSSNMEEFNLRVFIIVTHSVCGALH